MKKNNLRLLGSFSLALCVASFALACGDKDTDDGGIGGGGTGGADGSATGGRGTGTGGVDGGLGGVGGRPIDPDAPQVLKEATKVLDNAINPYGVIFGTDGKIYVSGTTDLGGVLEAQDNANLRLAVWRLNTDGTLDTGWGTNGVAVADSAANAGSATFANPGTSYDIVELADKSFVVHTAGAQGVALTKLSAAGDFSEPNFITAGWNTLDRSSLNDLAVAAKAACDADSTSADCTTKTAAAVAVWPALTAPNFAERPGQLSGWGMALDNSGTAEKLVLFMVGPAAKVASGVQRTDADRYIVRVDAGTLAVDGDFNGGAAFVMDVNGAGLDNNSRRGAVLDDGSIVSAGYSSYGGVLHVELIKLLPTGTADPAFSFANSAQAATYPALPGLAFFNPYTQGGPEAYAVKELSTGTLVTTGYGVSNFDVQTTENDLVSFAVQGDGLDVEFGGNKANDAAFFGSFAVQSEGDPNAGFGARPYRDNGRDLVVLSDNRTVQVGCYDDAAAIFVVTPDGKLDSNVGQGTGRLQYSYPSPFFKVAASANQSLLAATASSRPKVTTGTGSYAKALVALVKVTDAVN